MSGLKIAAVFLVVIVVQLSVFVDVRFAGVAPELLALAAVLAGFLAGPKRGATIAFVAGLLWDVWLPTPLGIAAMAYAMVAFVIGSVGAGLFHDSRLQIAAIASLGSAAAVMGYALLAEVVGQRGMVDLELFRVAFIAGILNAVFAGLLLPPMRWALGGADSAHTPAPTRP
jgi:rod shape-determining protein MreD